MPSYDWYCDSCREAGRKLVVETVRSIPMRDIPPGVACPDCDNQRWVRIQIQSIQVHVPGGRSESSIWPTTFNAIKDDNGVPVVIHNHKQYQQELDKRGLCNLNDYIDSNDKGSQHSCFDRFDIPPGPNAEKLLASATYVTESELRSQGVTP